MPTDILMPALSPTMEEGGLAKWLVKEGDEVHAGDVIAEIETDKATMEVEAYQDGRIGRILVPEGTEGVKVNSVIAVLLGEGEAIGTAGGDSAVSPAPREGNKEKALAPPAESARHEAPGEGQSPAATPQVGSLPASGERVANGDQERQFASPLARRLAKEAGLDLAGLHGSGPHGRVVEADIAAAKAGGAPATAAGDDVLGLYAPGSYELVPHDKMRRIIATRLVEAKRTIPHFYLTADLEIDALLALRHDINASAPTGKDGKPTYHVSLTDLVLKALARALIDVPQANVTWSESGMLHHGHADIGVAVAIPGGGLITPVMRAAETKPLSELSNEMKDLEKRARERKLLPEEYRGGVTSISNLGMYAVREFAAVINPPQSSILAVGAGTQRPVARKGAIEVATVMTVTLSVDHRAVDGVAGAELLRAFGRYIEKPAGMLV